MSKQLNLLGKRFGRLIVVGQLPSKKMKSRSICLCDCGKQMVCNSQDLKNGKTKSCGCSRNKNNSIAYKKLRWVFTSIKQRCNNKNNKGYKNYGGRGIVLEWSNFKEFYRDMGSAYKEGLSIDRIDNNGNYCKENCRRTTKKEQQNNTRKNRNITHKGKTMNLKQWSEYLGINYNTLCTRLYTYGRSEEKTLSI